MENGTSLQKSTVEITFLPVHYKNFSVTEILNNSSIRYLLCTPYKNFLASWYTWFVVPFIICIFFLFQLESFYEKNEETLTSANREVVQAIEKTKTNIKWMDSKYLTISSWLNEVSTINWEITGKYINQSARNKYVVRNI